MSAEFSGGIPLSSFSGQICSILLSSAHVPSSLASSSPSYCAELPLSPSYKVEEKRKSYFFEARLDCHGGIRQTFPKLFELHRWLCNTQKNKVTLHNCRFLRQTFVPQCEGRRKKGEEEGRGSSLPPPYFLGEERRKKKKRGITLAPPPPPPLCSRCSTKEKEVRPTSTPYQPTNQPGGPTPGHSRRKNKVILGHVKSQNVSSKNDCFGE